MLLLLPPALLFLSVLVILVQSQFPRAARYAWLVGIGGALMAWGSLFGVSFSLPLSLDVPFWGTFSEALSFYGDQVRWVYALTLMSVTVAVLLADLPAEVARRTLIAVGTLVLALLGLLAIFSATPLTLVFIWAASDLSEWAVLVRTTDSIQAIRSLTFGLATRILGMFLLLWASMLSISRGTPLHSGMVSSDIAPYLALVVALRLGVLPLHLPYPRESLLRRGFGTQLRVVSVVSALVLIGYLPSIAAPLLWWIAVPVWMATLLAAWSWLVAPNVLDGRVFWMIAGGALSILTAIAGDRDGSVAWGVLTLMAGSLLFLLAFDHRLLRLIALVGWWALSALPYSLTATAAPAYPMVLRLGIAVVQFLLALGYLIHWQEKRPGWQEQPIWVRNTHFVGILILSAHLLILGLRRPSSPIEMGLAFSSAVLVWLIFAFRRRLSFLRSPAAHWIRPSSLAWTHVSERLLQGPFHVLERSFQGLERLLEGPSGLLWSLLILIALTNLLAYFYR
ncbi:MAG: hypothetical protein ACK4VW_04515 [Anaerolineales bacterium]